MQHQEIVEAIQVASRNWKLLERLNQSRYNVTRIAKELKKDKSVVSRDKELRRQRLSSIYFWIWKGW